MDDFPTLHTVGLDDSLRWIRSLAEPVSRVVEFGCTSSEPFALLVHLKAHSVVIVEIEKANMMSSHGLSIVDEREHLQREHPQQFQPSSIQLVAGDMRRSPLASASFDLGFCRDVLYYFYADESSLSHAVSEMVRLLRPQGWIVAVEPKFGVRNLTDTSLGRIPGPEAPPVDMSPVFEALDLVKFKIADAPPYTYCYRKHVDGWAA